MVFASAIVAPTYGLPNPPIISTMNVLSIGRLGRTLGTSVPASTVWGATNRAYFLPFRTGAQPFALTAFKIANGSAVSGNFDVGLYDDGNGSSTINRLVSTGSTAQAGTTTIQSVAASYTIPPYFGGYLGLCFDNTTAAVFQKPSGASRLQAAGVAMMDVGAVTLPATATLALMTDANFPLFATSIGSI